MCNQKLEALARRHAAVSRQLDYACEILGALVLRARARGQMLNTPVILLQARLVNTLHTQQTKLFDQMLQT